MYERATGAKHQFTLPDRSTALAGKGAWTPDGRSIAVVHRASDAVDGRRWQLLVLDAATGIERDPGYRPSLGGVAIMRLLGWNGRTGQPVVAGYVAEAAPGPELGYGVSIMAPQMVRQIGVYELDATSSRSLLPATAITGLDVADVVITGGLTRPGRPPSTIGPTGWVAIGLAAALLAAIAGRALYRRRAVSRLR